MIYFVHHTLVHKVHDQKHVICTYELKSLCNKHLPEMVHEYNQHMMGVDRMDQKMAYYGFQRKSIKWWHKFSMHMYHTSRTPAALRRCN